VKETNIGVLFSSHELDEVADVCDRVVMIEDGRIVYDGVYHDSRIVVIRLKHDALVPSSLPDVRVSGNEISLTVPARMNNLIAAGLLDGNEITDISVRDDGLLRLFGDSDHRLSDPETYSP